jgi:hypothetical protein
MAEIPKKASGLIFGRPKGCIVKVVGTLLALLAVVFVIKSFFPKRCAHSPCEPGVALDPKCDTCVAKICPTGSEACCTQRWDGPDARSCVDQVNTMCNMRCDCENAATADTRPFNMYACDCTARECGVNPNWKCCSLDPGSTWSQACANDVLPQFGGVCTRWHP